MSKTTKYALINEKRSIMQNMQLKIRNLKSYCYEIHFYIAQLFFERLSNKMLTPRSP